MLLAVRFVFPTRLPGAKGTPLSCASHLALGSHCGTLALSPRWLIKINMSSSVFKKKKKKKLRKKKKKTHRSAGAPPRLTENETLRAGWGQPCLMFTKLAR